MHIMAPRTPVMLKVFLLVVNIICGALTLCTTLKVPLKRASGLMGKSVVPRGFMAIDASGHYMSYDVELHGKPGQGYYTEVNIGSPPQKLNILVDTGSSNFAVAACAGEQGYVTDFFDTSRSSTFLNLSREVEVLYTQGNWHGHLASDFIALPGLTNITSIRADIALITSSKHFFINGSGWQGIFGLAFKDIARPDPSVMPYFDGIVKTFGIPNEFCMLLCGTIDTPNRTDASMGGTLVLGEVDSSLYLGSLFYTPIRQEWYYEVIITDMGVDHRSLAMDCIKYNTDKSIVDSGTTNLRLPEDVFSTLVKEIKSETRLLDRQIPEDFWRGKVVMCFNDSSPPFYGFPNIYISLAEDGTGNKSSIQLDITPQQYLRAVGDDLDVSPGVDCYKFAIASSSRGTVIGAVIMEGFFVHFDRAKRRIGFGRSTCPTRDAGYKAYVSGGYNFTKGDTSKCGYTMPPRFTTLQIAAFVIASITAVFLIPLLGLAVHWLWQKYSGASCLARLRCPKGQQCGDNNDAAGLMDCGDNDEGTDS